MFLCTKWKTTPPSFAYDESQIHLEQRLAFVGIASEKVSSRVRDLRQQYVHKGYLGTVSNNLETTFIKCCHGLLTYIEHYTGMEYMKLYRHPNRRCIP